MYHVYKHTCPNSKVYIGMTERKPEDRWGGGYAYHRNKRFFKDIIKYGWDNIKHEILSVHSTREDALKEEAAQIVLHRATLAQYEYNTLAQNHAQCTPVAQYTKDGKHIATYQSMKDASIATGIHISTICLVCKNQSNHKTAGGYIWKYIEQEKEVG